MINRVLHITVPNSVSSIQLKVIHRARVLHPEWEVKVWKDPVPRDDFLLQGYWEKVNSGAQFADLLRLDALYRFGGVYIDSDMTLNKPLDDLVREYDFFIASEDGQLLTNAVIGACQASPIVKRLIDALIENEPDWTLPPNDTTGPVFFTEQLKWRKEITVLPRETFYPYNWDEERRACHRHSFGEHLWSLSWFTEDKLPAHRRQITSTVSPTLKRRFTSALKQPLKRAIVWVFRTRNRLRALDPAQSANAVSVPVVKSYSCNGEIVVRTVHGFNIFVDGCDGSLTPSLMFNGCYELAEEKFFTNTLRGGDWVIDVGANIGSFSILAARCVGPFGRVYAYEPNPRPFGLLSRSLVMNWMHERVILRPVGVGDEKGSMHLSYTANQLGGSQILHESLSESVFSNTVSTLSNNDVGRVEVPMVRLDDEFPVDLPIKILKVDVEGWEDAVLRGGKRLFEQKCADYIMLEVLKDIAGARWMRLMTELKKLISHGYVVCNLSDEGQLIEQNDLSTAIRNMRGRNIVLAARDANRLTEGR